MNFRGYTYPPALDDQLKSMVREGITMLEMALRLNMTRSQIAGRIYRLRQIMKDETFRPGYVVGRLWVPPGQGRAKKKQASGWAKWRARNGGAVMAAIVKREPSIKSQRKIEAHKMMRNHIACCANPTDLFARTGCCWPLWGDDDPSFSNKLYCNNIPEQGNKYCPAHARLRHEYVPGVMLPRPGVKLNWSIKRRAA